MVSRIGTLFSLGAILLSLFLSTPSEGAVFYEQCSVIGFDQRNGDATWILYKNRELWEFNCQGTIVKACLDNSAKYGNNLTTTHLKTYEIIEKLLQDLLLTPARKMALWVDQATPSTNQCYGYWNLLRVCTIPNCYSENHF